MRARALSLRESLFYDFSGVVNYARYYESNFVLIREFIEEILITFHGIFISFRDSRKTPKCVDCNCNSLNCVCSAGEKNIVLCFFLLFI